jgi:hypothetical protein
MDRLTEVVTTLGAICTLLSLGSQALKYMAVIFVLFAISKGIDAFYAWKRASQQKDATYHTFIHALLASITGGILATMTLCDRGAVDSPDVPAVATTIKHLTTSINWWLPFDAILRLKQMAMPLINGNAATFLVSALISDRVKSDD